MTTETPALKGLDWNAAQRELQGLRRGCKAAVQRQLPDLTWRVLDPWSDQPVTVADTTSNNWEVVL